MKCNNRSRRSKRIWSKYSYHQTIMPATTDIKSAIFNNPRARAAAATIFASADVAAAAEAPCYAVAVSLLATPAAMTKAPATAMAKAPATGTAAPAFAAMGLSGMCSLHDERMAGSSFPLIGSRSGEGRLHKGIERQVARSGQDSNWCWQRHGLKTKACCLLQLVEILGSAWYCNCSYACSDDNFLFCFVLFVVLRLPHLKFLFVCFVSFRAVCISACCKVAVA